jgi:hypothetical protein
VRRILGILALATVFVVATAAPAAAHPGIEDPYLPVGRPATVAFGVPSEEPGSMVEVELALPADLALQRVNPTPGWSHETTAGGIRFFGGDVPQGQYVQFSFVGVFSHKRIVEMPVLTRSSLGLVRNWTGGAWPPALAFPGYPRGTAPIGGSSGPGTATLVRWGGTILMAGGAVALIVLLMARRRRPVRVP